MYVRGRWGGVNIDHLLIICLSAYNIENDLKYRFSFTNTRQTTKTNTGEHFDYSRNRALSNIKQVPFWRLITFMGEKITIYGRICHPSSKIKSSYGIHPNDICKALVWPLFLFCFFFLTTPMYRLIVG